MAVDLSYSGDFSAEKSLLVQLENDINAELSSIISDFTELSAYWKDKKSPNFVAEKQTQIKSIQSSVSACFSDLYSNFDAISAKFENAYQTRA